jgi:acyl-CoA synthetase (AMP-forming)/AMP-acid ligase II
VQGAFGIEPSDKAVVAFAPFAVIAPALGIPSVVPPMDVTKPAKLTARTLADAATAIDATVVFASPAVLTNIAATSRELEGPGRSALQSIRAVATAGAPVSPQLLAAIQPVFPNAHFFTPYGMTELMPVTIASANEIGAGASNVGVCVGQPLSTVELAIRPITAPSGTLPDPLATGMLGEVWVRADHSSQGYDRLWRQQNHAFVNGPSISDKDQIAPPAKQTKGRDLSLKAPRHETVREGSWHRSGDVGHLDALGRLWIEGRVDHLIHAATGVFAPVETELQAESVSGIDQAVAVGVGPIGTQQLAVVVAGDSIGSVVVADAGVTAAVRAAVSARVAAVLVAPKIPVDRRHNSKIDRTRVQKWAEVVLRGGKPPRL